MGNGKRYVPEQAPGYYPQLDEKQLEAFRGLTHRGLARASRPETLSSLVDPKTGGITGCSDLELLNDLERAIAGLETRPHNLDAPGRPTIVLDARTVRMLIDKGHFVSTFRNDTACLLRVASLIDRCLSDDLYTRARRDFFALVELLVEIGDQVIRRTQKPYRAFGDVDLRPKLNDGVLQVEPMTRYNHWKTLLDARSGRALISPPVPLKEVRFKVNDKDGWERTLDQIEWNLQNRQVQEQIAAAAVSDTPTLNPYLYNLRRLRFTDIERQTRARFPMGWRDDTVYTLLRCIIYHSVCPVLLDRDGNPLSLRDWAYGILDGGPGRELLRVLQPPGLYLSVGRGSDYQLAVRGLEVKPLLMGGITSFFRVQSTMQLEHELQQELQAYLNAREPAVIAAITVDEAFQSADLTVSGVKRRLPDLAEGTISYALIELLKRLPRLVENYEEVVKQVTLEGIKGVIRQKVREWFIDYIIKKLGKKIIPGVNVVSVAADLLDDEQIAMGRAAVAAVIMAVKSRRPDDLTISSKVLSKIAVDKVQEAVIKELVKHVVRRASKQRPAPEQQKGATKEPQASQTDSPTSDKPSSDKPALDKTATPADQGQSRKPTATPSTPTTDPRATSDPKTQGTPRQKKKSDVFDRTQEEMDQAARLAEAKKQNTATAKQSTATTDKKASDQQEELARKTDDPKTSDKAVKNDGTGDAVVSRPRPVPQEPPLPEKRDMPSGERWAFFQQHWAQYPPHIQQRIDTLKTKKPSKDDLNELDREIRAHYAFKLEQHLNIPITKAERIPTSGPGGSGGDWEKTNQSLRTGRRPQLSITSRTRDRNPVQIDDFDVDRRVPREYKASLEIRNQDPEVAKRKIQERMERHGQFAQDYHLPHYEWVANSQRDAKIMNDALADLKAKAMRVPEPLRQKQLDRYRKIHIVEELFFD